MDPPLSAPLSHAPNSSAAPSNISCNNPAVSNHNALSTAPAPRDSAPTPVPNIAANAPGFGLPPHFAFGPNFPSMTSGINIPPGYPSFPQAAPHPQNSIQPSPALPGPGSAAGMFYNYNASTAGTDLNSYNLSLFSNSAAATHFGAAAPFLSGASSSDPRGKHMPMNPTSYAPFSAPNTHQPNSDPAASGAGSSGTGSSASPTVAGPRQFSHPSQFSINAGGQGQLATGAGMMHAPPPAAPNSFAAWNDAYSSSSSHYLAGQQSGAFPPNMEPDFRFWTSYGDMSGQNQFWSAPWEMSSMGALSMASSLMPNYNYSSLPNHNLGFPAMGFMPTMMDPGMAVPSVLRDSSAGPVPMFDDSPEARALSAGQIPAYLTRPPTQSTQDSHASPIKHAAPSNFAQPHPSSHKQQQQQQQSEQPSQKQPPNTTSAASNLVQFGSPFASVPMNLSEADSAHKSPPNGPFPSSERSPATTASASSRDISTTTLASDMSVSSDSFARHAPIRVNTTLPPLIPRSSSHHSLPFFGAGPSQDPVFYPPWAYPVISTSSSPNSSTSARSSAIDSNLTVPTEVPSAHSSGSSRTLRRSSASASVASAARPSAEVSEESPASKKRARSPVSAIVVTSGAPMLAKPVTDIPKGAPKVTVSAPASAASSPASSGSSVDVKTEPVEDTGGKPTKSKKRRAKRQRAQPALLSGKFVSPVVCGALRPGESSPHPSRIRMYSPFFKKSVAVYTALNDPRRRVLYQTTDLTRMLGCNNNMLAMYLNRRKSTPDSGIFQANTILHKSHSDKSVKIGGYFLSQPACEAFRVYYETSKGKIVTGSTAEEAKSPTELYQPPSPSASSDQTAKSAKEASSNSGALPNSPSFDSALQLIASAASSLSVDSCPPSPTASSRAASSPTSEHQAAAAEANHRYTSSVSSVQSYGVSTGSSLSSTLTSFSSLATTAGSLASLLPSDPGSTSSSASSSSSSASSASSPVLASAAAGEQPDHPAPAPSEVAADLSSSAAASSSVSSSLSSPTLHSNASETSSSDAAKKMQTE